MGRIGLAIAGVAASATVAGGAYAFEVYADGDRNSDLVECGARFDDNKMRDICVDSTIEVHDKDEGLHIIEFAGMVGIVGFGYLGYKTVKEELGVSGLVDDII